MSSCHFCRLRIKNSWVQILLREKSGHKTHKKQYSSCHFKQQMSSIALLFTTANSSKADTTRVFEEKVWSGQLNLSVNVWSRRFWFQHYARIIPFSVKGMDGGDAFREGAWVKRYIREPSRLICWGIMQ